MSELQAIHGLYQFYPNLKFTHKKSKEKINFLDLVIKHTNGKTFSNLYCKPTDSHQYLYYDSCHAEHITRSIVFSQTLQTLIENCVLRT